MPWWGVLIIVLVAILVVLAVLYFIGRRRQKQMDAQQEQIDAQKQQVSMLVIDKKKVKIKDSGMPQAVIDQVPKLMSIRKFPIVKAKVGPRIMSFIAEPKVFDAIPVKKEIKATVSGLYITEIKGVRGPIESQNSKGGKGSKNTGSTSKKSSGGKFETLLKKGRGEL